ncbi:MAG: hypothetical protein CXT73_06820 [Methanobacteriota archaeon]|nr:MAG: hypothetical protein CXT73_06820 [Euryarchaeota archaeon]
MAKKAKMNKKRKELNAVHPFYLNMTHTGRLITACNTNSPTPSNQQCYGQYMKKKIKNYVENRADVGVKRMPNNSSSLYTDNKTSQTIADQLCCAATTPVCNNDCSGGSNKKRSNVTKDLPYKSASWKIAKAKANRKCMCNADYKLNTYETAIYGNHPVGGC